jgi:hypothetical protein
MEGNMRMLDFSNVYPSLLNLMVVGMMSVIFISVMKYLTNLYQIPGLSDLMASI